MVFLPYRNSRMSALDSKTDSFRLKLECVECKRLVVPPKDKLLQFAFCGCKNEARIGFQSEKDGAYLFGAQNEEKAFVHVFDQAETKVLLPKTLLKRWKSLQKRFKTEGTLT